MRRAYLRQQDPLARHSVSPSELSQLNAAERAGRSVLAYRNSDGALELFLLPAVDGVLRIGRRDGMDLEIPWDPEVSGLHAELQTVGGEVVLVDDGLSMNGTFVNSQRLRGRERLRSGDLIRIGQTALAFRTPASSVSERTAMAVESPESHDVSETQRQILIALCRPFRDGSSYVTPASTPAIAKEVSLTVHSVKMHLRKLYAMFGLTKLPPNEKRARLAQTALEFGLVTQRDFG